MGKESKQVVSQQLDPTTQQLQRLAIGSGLGALGLSGVSTSSMDPAQRAAFERMAGRGGMLGQMARGALAQTTGNITPIGPQLQPVPGVDPLTQQAIGGYQQALTAGNLGMGALSGDQAAINQLMNPYQTGVLDAVKGQFGDLAARTSNTINDQATQAGAFGGTRHGVAQGIALGELDKGLGQQLAGLQYQGFSDMMDRAGGLANLGFGAAGQLNQLGEYQRQVAMQQDPAMRQLGILQGLLSGNPIAMSTTQTQSGNLLNGLLGVGATLGGLGFNPFGKKGG